MATIKEVLLKMGRCLKTRVPLGSLLDGRGTDVGFRALSFGRGSKASQKSRNHICFYKDSNGITQGSHQLGIAFALFLGAF